MNAVILIFLVLFVLFALGLFSISEGSRTKSKPQPRPQGETVARAAVQAARRAGYAGGRSHVQVTDIGVLAYRGTDDPRLVRSGAVMTDTDYLRPFVELWLPHKARGQVRFELFDGADRLRYADEAHYNLSPGRNTLLPGTWLPLQKVMIDAQDDWRLRVQAGETLLAVHMMSWQNVGGGEIQRYVESDGEISPDLHRLIQVQALEGVSLSELLADQEE